MDAQGTKQVGLAMGLTGLLMASYGGVEGILSGLSKSIDHPSSTANLKT